MLLSPANLLIHSFKYVHSVVHLENKSGFCVSLTINIETREDRIQVVANDSDASMERYQS